jgi:hypothetical protein
LVRKKLQIFVGWWLGQRTSRDWIRILLDTEQGLKLVENYERRFENRKINK